jgi:hypothetical protein
MFTNLYEFLHGPQADGLYALQIYNYCGVVLLLLTASSTALYYYVVGSMSSEFNMIRHWAIALLLNAAACMFGVILICRGVLETWTVDTPIVTLTLIQGLYAALLFGLSSALFKWWSPNARRTPW